MKNVIVIGAGAVGAATAHKCAQHNDELGEICLASRTPAKCEAIVADIARRGSAREPGTPIRVAGVDARDRRQVAGLIERENAALVINVASPYCNLGVIEACLESGAHYIDTAVYEREGEINVPAPWYANYEWKYRERFAERGLSGILGMGFDPGAVNVFCAYARKHLVADIDSIDIMDVNGGDHGRYFATNFDAETNLREIMEDVLYWEDGEWRSVPCHSRSRLFDFPVLGEQRVYSMGHDEIHSLACNIPARRIEFWMGFGERYLAVFEVLKNLGLLSNEAVSVDGVEVVPVRLVKALLPDPGELAAGYSGGVCIGCLVEGRQAGAPRRVFVYSTCEHPACYREIGAQAISYTTAVPVVTAALLLSRGVWNPRRLVNAEELDPDPFMALMPELGIGWDVQDLDADDSRAAGKPRRPEE